MKKLLLAVMILFFANTFAKAQFQTVSGHITTNTTWTNDKVYRMDGFVYIDSNATLTIQPGTIVRGIKLTKGTLIVTRGGKLVADGTVDKPIVFTSDEPAGTRTYGDWGGIIVLGNAPINPVGGQATIEGGVNNAAGDGQYGGPNAADNSGIIRYVRIEYSGIPFSANNEINGLTMGGVGSGTIIDYVMVSYNGDDSFEWFGGTVNCKHLIAYKGVDDDFDTDFGFAGKVQFGLAIRDANVFDQAGDSNSFESDNDATGSGASPKTKALFSNITSIGPKVTSTSVVNSKYNNALRLRRNTTCSAYNSVFMGWPNGVFIEGDSAAKNANNDLLQMSNTFVSGSTVALKKSTVNTVFDVTAWFNGAGKRDSVLTENTEVMLNNPFAAVPNCLPMTGSPVLNRASFTNSRLTNSFFSPTTYIGAFGTSDWTAKWANYDPQNTNYNIPTVTAAFSVTVQNKVVTVVNNSTGATNYSWNFGDNTALDTNKNTTHTYAANGGYKIVLTSSNLLYSAKDSISVSINTGPQYQVVSGHITGNTTWTNDRIYRMDGFVYVDSNATLTIQPGTIVRGIKLTKGALIVTRGGKLIADGTVDKPIIFTSDEPAGTRTYGDWGGIILLGSAPINPVGGQATIEGGVNNAAGDGQYGGTNATDNSGIIRYVRIEYSGIPFSANNEINGLTMGGVGSGTVIDYVMVSYNGDDSFEWFGGTVDCKHLIAYKGVDDDFDTDFGYAGKVQFGLAVRDANVADQAGDSNSFESDNDATGSGASPKTKALFSNITSIGPKVTSSTVVSSKYNNALRLRRNTSCSAYNSVFMGWPNGVYIEGDSAAKNANNDLLQMSNTIISGSAVPLKKLSTNITFDVNAWFNGAGKKDTIIPANTDVMLTDPFAATPNCLPMTGSPVLNRASFTNSRLTNSFFDVTSYVGAFGSDNWTATWANFDPQNANYSELPMTASFTTVVDSFKATFTNKSLNAYTFDWSFGDNTANSTDENPVHTYAAIGTYKVILTTSNGISTKKDSSLVTINVLPTAKFTSVTDSFKVTFANKSTFASSYSWNFGDNNTSTLENPVHTYAANGTYKVVLTASNGISSTKDSANIVISVVGVDNTKLMNQLVLYPNPVNNNATVAFNLMQSAKLSVKVLDINGRTIATIADNTNFSAGVQNLTIDASAFEAGVYMVRLYNKETASTIRFVVVR
jgi:PKD repeat protein